MRSSPLHRRPLRGIPALCCLLAFHAHASHPDNPPVTECECPKEVDLISEHDTDEEGNYKLKASTDGIFEIEVMAIPPDNVNNPPTPTFTLRDKNGAEIDSEEAWQHKFTFAANGLESPITLEFTVPCTDYGADDHKICEPQLKFVFGCDAGDCGSGSGGTCQSGTGSPSGGVNPGSQEPFQFSVPIGSNSQGDETTGLHFNASPDTAIDISDFKIHSNGGHTKDGNEITTGTTETTLSENNGVITVGIVKTGDTVPFKTYQFTSDTTAKTLTMVETSCGQDPVTHQWKKDSGTFSYSTANGMRVKTAVVEQDQDFVRIERHKVFEKVGANDVLVSDERLHYRTSEWGNRLIKREVDPDGENLTSTWTYGKSTDGNAYGRLMEHVRHDGLVETHTYTNEAADKGSHKVDYPDGRSVLTTWFAGTTEVTEKQGTTVVSKTKEIRSGNSLFVKRFTDANENNALVTTTTYMPTGSDFGGMPSLVVRPDGTATKYTYLRVSGERIVTVENGLLVSGNITDGTRTVTTTNAQGQVIEEKTTDIGTGIVLAHTKGLLPDGHGRPTTIHHFPDGQGGFAYHETRAYSCCGLVSETDRHGVTTLHAYDALKRRIRSNRLDVTTETHHKGLVTETYRYHDEVTGTFPSTLGGSSGDLIARETRNLAGTLHESETPSPTSTTAGTLVLSSSVETEYAPAAGLSRRVTTTVPGNHSQIEDFDLARRLVKSTGALSPAMEYAHTATATGLLSARAYLDGANHREITASQADWSGRTLKTGRLATLASTALLDATAHDYSPSTGQLLSTTDADGVTTLYAYNGRGERIITAVDLNNNDTLDYGTDQITRTDTFAATRPGSPAIPVIRSETHVWLDGDPVGSPTLVSYNERTADGLNAWSWQIGHGETHTVSTTGLARTETTVRPDDTYTVNTYAGGLLESTESFDSDDNSIVSTTYGYDDLNRPTTSADSRIGTTTTAYLSATTDFIASVTDAGSRQTLYAYDSRGRQTTVTLPDTTETHTTYTTRGEAEARWGSQTYPEFRTYDYAGRLKTLRTKPDFDQGAPVNTGGSLTTWNHYTTTGLLHEKLDHNDKGPEYTYTAAGRLQTRKWAREISAGVRVTTTYAYTHGRLTGVTYNDATPNLVYTHDTLGRIRTVTRGGNNHAEYVYDPDTLLLETEKLNLDTHPRHLHRHYGDHGRPLSLDLATTTGTSQYTTGYGYDIAGRLQHVWHHPSLHSTTKAPTGDPTFTYSYTYTQAQAGALRVGATSGQDLKQDFMPYTVTRNAAGSNPTLIANRTYEGTRDTLKTIENKAGATVVSSYTYEVNSIGQRTSVTTTGSAFAGTPADWDWGYDSLGQLDFAEHGATTASHRVYEYDSIGNRKKTAHGTTTLPQNDNHAANALNQYTQVPDYTPQPVHDLDGNLTRGPVPGTNGNNAGVQAPADATLIEWDAENRMISCQIGTATYRFEYDHLSRLIVRKFNTFVIRHYHYDGWNRIAEFTNTTLIDTFTWGLDLSGTMQGAGGVGGLLATRWVNASGSPDYFTTYDGNGNVSEYLASAGTATVHYEYDPFGSLTRRTGDTSVRFQYRFSTKPRDFNTGLYYYGYRWLDPLTGRWPSRDPIEEEGGVNLYGFVGNEPISSFDIHGLDVYITSRPLNIGYFKPFHLSLFYPVVSHVYLTIDNENMGSAWRRYARQNYLNCSIACTFSFHPDSVRAEREGGQKGRNNRISTLITDGSWVESDYRLDIRYYQANGTNMLVTQDECEQIKILKEIIKSRKSNNSGSPDPGQYSFGMNNCGHWSRLMIERAGLSVPSGASSWNLGVGMGNNISSIAGATVTNVGRRLVDGFDYLKKSSRPRTSLSPIHRR